MLKVKVVEEQQLWAIMRSREGRGSLEIIPLLYPELGCPGHLVQGVRGSLAVLRWCPRL